MQRQWVARLGLAVALLFGSAAGASAGQRIGNFLIDSLVTKFGDGAGISVATFYNDSVLSIHCDRESARYVVSVGSMRQPSVDHLEQVSVEVKIDDQLFLTTTGTAPAESDYERAAEQNHWLVAIGWVVWLQDSDRIINAVGDANKAAFHLTRKDGQSFDLIFPLIESNRIVHLLKQTQCGTPAGG
jgi:hypothetical protein